jgi:phenylpropionate dioxygenase-like ring-hydroxylating dioxygenase large terminal subunit
VAGFAFWNGPFAGGEHRGNEDATMDGTFVREGWYATAWSEEVTRAPLERWVTGIPFVLYRKADGSPVALEGTCPHRGYPLALGRIRGDALECGYHGITFGADGACVAVPGGQRAPGAMGVRAIPLLERGGLIWLWPGEPAAADPALCAERWLADPLFTSVHFSKNLEARASLLIENLMDLTHETFIHADSIGDGHIPEQPLVTESFDDHVRASRTIPGITPPPFYAKFGLSGTVDRGQVAEFWAPGLCLVFTSIVPRTPGQPTITWTTIHGVTPETATRTRYHFAVARNFALGDAAADELLIAGSHKVLDEDVAAIEAQERRLQQLQPGRRELSVASDAGALAARKLYLQL